MRVKHTAAGEYDGLVDVGYLNESSLMPWQRSSFSLLQGLRALANDVTYVLDRRPSGRTDMIRNDDAKHLYRGHASNVRYLWRQTFSVLALGICEDDFSRFGPV